MLVRETEAEAFAEGAALPIVAENCPACFDAPKERYRVKCLLATQEAAFPMLFQSLTKCARSTAPAVRRHYATALQLPCSHPPFASTLLLTSASLPLCCRCLLPLMEPGVEDFLRLRREAYGKASGPVH